MLSTLKSALGRFKHAFKLYVVRDPFLVEVKRWFDADGDNTLRLQYPLTEESVVWDIGGYHGDFAQAIYGKYSCYIDVFEPLPEFHAICEKRFVKAPKIRTLKYGLSNQNAQFALSNDADRTSFIKASKHVSQQQAQLRSITEVIDELNIASIDLLKINIEGGEFDVLPALINSGLIGRVKFLQIQFHDFFPEAKAKRDAIRTGLEQTHTELWSYPFVWECWQIKRGEGRSS